MHRHVIGRTARHASRPLCASPGIEPTPARRAARACAAAVLLAVLACACAAAVAEQGRVLDTGAIEALITGNTFRGAYRARQLTMVFYADGVVRGSLGLTGSDDGRWEVADGVYCHQWVGYFGGVRRCYRWRVRGDGYLLENVDAFRTFDIPGRVEQGKPDGY